ncbi:MAG: UvrD-helicase domain-containing protein [Candidatus Latescibacteria bacterium]|nr:UvrD-helicase domain-containing protein [Candidatus Latescibacterota bacterium]NIM22134.1 UvrD-helicase domain-containing protein [Candidatus Latescibacterota bacterium]NIM64684.1 UvrD-helicase domain-containing protein [Candidatus Latescibacterota bacterium]NIO01194.1 UvrD-helicase domain-containing protein [Candidatus Latescibacterota bacterium]NIO27579.1 UvrD-helicase domain-containing protein [Candidatus Latescibacterota bacterium]
MHYPNRSSLNEDQLKAVTTTDGPVLVIAGAGSGKTRVLTERIVYLVGEKKVSPWNILAFTFTNKAALEMKNRLERMIPGISESLWVGTFHATGVRILRNHGEYIGIQKWFSIYDAEDSLNLLKNLLSKNVPQGRLIRSPRVLRDTISRWKNDFLLPEQAFERAADNVERRMVTLYQEYEKELKRAKALDFDDLIVKPVKLFSIHQNIKDLYSERFRYVLVDEFQDTNPIQMAFIEALSSYHGNLFVVGDDDQSIYGWRGARVEHILNFEGLYPGTNVIRLERNYRSTRTILDAANHVIAFNKGRKGKNLWTDDEEGEKVKLVVSMDEETEAMNVLQTVLSLLEKGLERKDIAVLYRTNAQSRALEDVLKRGSVPYQIIGSVSFYDRMEVRDILAYCKLICNPSDLVSLRRIINVPRRALGKATVAKLETLAASGGIPVTELIASGEYDVGAKQKKKSKEFLKTFRVLERLARSTHAAEVIEAIIEQTDYLKYLKENYPDAESRIENAEELVAAAEAFADTHEDATLRAFLEEVALVSDVDALDEEKGLLTLMTLHNAKGLEFECVIIAGLEEGLFPHHSSLDNLDELEEERRLFYVGMTRAKKYLYLSFANMRRRMGFIEGETPSRFLAEIPERCIEGDIEGVEIWPRTEMGDELDGSDELGAPKVKGAAERKRLEFEDYSQEEVVYTVGMLIYHQAYGKGIVRKVEGSGKNLRVTILFDRGSERKFVALHAPMRPL